MALEIYCQIEKIPCESNIKAYEKWFKVESFSFGGAYSFNPREEQGTGSTELMPIGVTKIMDKSSALISEAVLYKLKVPKIVIEIVNDKPGTGGRSKHLTYTFETCRITSFQQTASDPMHESFTFAYRVAKMDDHFTSQKMQYDLAKPEAKTSL